MGPFILKVDQRNGGCPRNSLLFASPFWLSGALRSEPRFSIMFNSYIKEHVPVYPNVPSHALDHASPPSAPTVNDTTNSNGDNATYSGSVLPEASSSTCLPLTNTAGSPSVHGHDLSPYTTLPSVYNNPYAALSAPEEYPFPILAPLPGTSSPTQNDTYAGLIPVTSPHLPPSSFPGPSHLTPFTSTFSTTEASAAPSTPPQRIPRPDRKSVV